MAIVVSGYTAAGKTTQGRILAAALGFEHVWAAGRLLAELGYSDVEAQESELWYHRFDEINERRARCDADQVVDAMLVDYVGRDDVVVDSRFLPWIERGRPVIAVWLESDLLGRARKCQHSLRGPTGGPGLLDCATFAHRKDGEDVDRVAHAYGGVYCPDPERFDLVLNVSPFATEEAFADVPAAIRRCSDFVIGAVTWRMGDERRAVALLRAEPALAQIVYAAVPGLAAPASDPWDRY